MNKLYHALIFLFKATKNKAYTTLPCLLAYQSSFRTFEWAKAFPVPDLALKQINDLLSIA